MIKKITFCVFYVGYWFYLKGLLILAKSVSYNCFFGRK